MNGEEYTAGQIIKETLEYSRNPPIIQSAQDIIDDITAAERINMIVELLNKMEEFDQEIEDSRRFLE